MAIVNIGGYDVIVDDDAIELMKPYKWHPIKRSKGHWIYFVGHKNVDKKRISVLLHRLIASSPNGLEVDHINANWLDNRRDNLRPCSRSQNAMNSIIRSDNTSGHKGVGWHNRAQKYRARIMVNYKEIHLGLFSSYEDACLAYEKASRMYHGDFGRIA